MARVFEAGTAQADIVGEGRLLESMSATVYSVEFDPDSGQMASVEMAGHGDHILIKPTPPM